MKLDPRELILMISLLGWLKHDSLLVSCQPSDIFATVNQSTYFNCSTREPEIIWYHFPFGLDESHGGSPVYRPGTFYGIYTEDFKVDTYSINGTHFCNLIVNPVKEDFAGRYECRDKYGVRTASYSELIVIDSDPVCKSNSSPDGFIVAKDFGLEVELYLSCSITFRGKIPPTLQWTKANDVHTALNVTQEVSKVTYNATTKVGYDANGLSFTCQTTQLVDGQRSCASNVKVLYAFNTTAIQENRIIGEEVNCMVNTSSHSCQFEWKLYDKQEQKVVANSRVLKIDRSGIHQCLATCELLDKKVSIYGTAVNVSESFPVSNPGMPGGVIALIVISILVFLLVMLVGFICRRRRRQRKSSIKGSPESNRLSSISISCPDEDKILVKSEKGDNNDKDCTELSPFVSGQKEEFDLINNKPSISEPCADEGRHQKRKRGYEDSDNEDEEILGRSAYQNMNIPEGPHTLEKFPYQVADAGNLEEPKLICTLTAQEEKNYQKSISGIAILNGELFVTFEGSGVVEVFQAVALVTDRSFVVAELSNPLDIASSPTQHCLYIYSSVEKKSIEENPVGKIFCFDCLGRTIIIWETEGNKASLSVTCDSNILLSIWGRGLLEEYSSNGQILREVKLTQNLRPFSALKLSSGEFIICYEMQQHHGICLVNFNGELVTNVSEDLAFPRHLAMTSDNKVLIADYKNSRILLLDQEFEMTEILCNEDGLIRPVRLCYESQCNRIFVADNGERKHQVLVFTA